MSIRKSQMPAWGGAAAACFLLPTFLTQACEARPQLQTETFELDHMNPDEAMEMIRPYVYEERAGAAGVVAGFESGVTVRETPESLARIREVLERYDRPKPGVRLQFQIIEADGYEGRDPRIADVEEVLDALFRFEGYRLAAEAQMAMMVGTHSRQPVAMGDLPAELMASVEHVRVTGEGSGSVTLSVHLQSGVMGPSITTTLTVPVGETVVLGSSQSEVASPTTILTVRPELVPF